jgi:hypothetical protein
MTTGRRIIIIVVVAKMTILGWCAQYQGGAHTKQKLFDVKTSRLRDWGASLHHLSVLAPAILTSIALSFNTLVIT